MKKKLFLIFPVVIFGGCCIRNKTFPQSDRFDTHRPKFPVIECIPCADLRNAHEHFITAEAWGPSSGLSLGLEMGHNFNQLRIYGSGSFSYWPFRQPATTFTGDLGIVVFNPNLPIRPEFGIGYNDWIIKSKQGEFVPVHPSMKKAMVEAGNYQSWQAYGGLRIKIQYSNIDLGLRLYRMETFKPKGYSSWYPGLVCGFRF